MRSDDNVISGTDVSLPPATWQQDHEGVFF